MDIGVNALALADSNEKTQEVLGSYPALGFSCWYVSRVATFICVSVAVLIGTAYILAQWAGNRTIADALFVGLLLGATVVLFSGMKAIYRFLLRRGLEFFAHTAEKTNERVEIEKYSDFVHGVFNTKTMTLAGFLYGSVIAFSPFVLGVWTEKLELRILLAAFLFSINFPTGVAFTGLITFCVKSVKLGQRVKVDLWQKENPGTYFLLGAARRVSLLASVYICLCNASVLFSVLPLTGFVLGYAVFAGAVIVLSLLVPALPIVQKIAASKQEALLRVNIQIQAEFGRILENSRSEDGTVNLTRLESLMALRDKIDNTNVWPFRVKAISTAASVVMVSLLPPLLQTLLEKYWK